ncbi:MAG TPA: FAD:protein FMN transferase [Candidatus Paceibacterota bacterium]|nr:FAD:protein FMN transferase [Candidatus Paceibacterota bacterium]
MKEFEYQKRVMGSEANLSIIAEDKAAADATAHTLFAIAENEEARFSRFREESELSKLNRERSRTVSKELMDAILLGRELYRKTGGVFNPLVDISRFGYDADIAAVKDTDRAGGKPAPYDIDMESIVIDEDAMSVTLQEGQHFDVGGYMKGHTAELMAAAAAHCQGVLVNLGGDIYVRGYDAEGKPFVFVVDDPTDSAATIAFSVTDAGIATSGSYKRHWKLQGTPFFHILDKEGTKNPETEILSATVIAPTGAGSDAFATAALILGPEAGAAFLEKNGCEYCFIHKDGTHTLSRAFPLVQKTELPTYV